MRVMVLGKNGREHALAWKIAQSPLVTKVYCAPGNPGTARIAENIDCDILNPQAVVYLTRELKIDLLVIGPEDPLAAGVADAVRDSNPSCPVFGPNRDGARLEWSKAYSKDFMRKYNIPTAEFKAYADINAAYKFLETCQLPIVIKADGLAAGKGVIIAHTRVEALQAVNKLPQHQSVVIEEYLTGREVSVFAITDGKRYHILESAEDHKQLYDGDLGPNTGGMGAYSPVNYMGPELVQAVKQIIDNTMDGLEQEGITYRGILFLGLMLTSAGPKVLEYNSRFGDPECQVLMSRLSSDVVPYLLGAAQGKLPKTPPLWSTDYVALIVACGGEYPMQSSKGQVISGVETAESLGCMVFHAGTAIQNNQLVTNGGRILNVVAKHSSLTAALDLVYQGINKISFENMHYRKDIGRRKVR